MDQVGQVDQTDQVVQVGEVDLFHLRRIKVPDSDRNAMIGIFCLQHRFPDHSKLYMGAPKLNIQTGLDIFEEACHAKNPPHKHRLAVDGLTKEKLTFLQARIQILSSKSASPNF